MHGRASIVALAGAVILAGCGGSGGGGNTPTTPTPTSTSTPTGSGSTTVTISIMGDRGNLSFSPNPATVPAGQMVIWRNTDTVVHRVILEGLVDTGNINPGASTQPLELGAVVKAYRCSLHPGMVGSLNGAATPSTDDCPNNEGYGCR